MIIRITGAFLLLIALQLQADFLKNFSVTYDTISNIACHNCYEKQYAKTFTSCLDSTRILEIDFWDSGYLIFGAKPAHWFVRHLPGLTPFRNTGNNNNCSTANGRENNLEGCLKDLADWSRKHKGHEVITIYLDKKQGWHKDRSPMDLDQLIINTIGRERLFTPADLSGKTASPREAARQGLWPTLASLREKFIFILNGGAFNDRNGTLHEYVATRKEAAVIFAGPDAYQAQEITGVPYSFNKETAEWVVFYNLSRSYLELAPVIKSQRYIARLWGADKVSRETLKAYKIGALALYNFRVPKTLKQNVIPLRAE